MEMVEPPAGAAIGDGMFVQGLYATALSLNLFCTYLLLQVELVEPPAGTAVG